MHCLDLSWLVLKLQERPFSCFSLKALCLKLGFESQAAFGRLLREHLLKKRMFSFRHCPNYLPLDSIQFCKIWLSCWTPCYATDESQLGVLGSASRARSLNHSIYQSIKLKLLVGRHPPLCHQCTIAAVFLGLTNTCCNRNGLNYLLSGKEARGCSWETFDLLSARHCTSANSFPNT